jgi:hypothetical protein
MVSENSILPQAPFSLTPFACTPQRYLDRKCPSFATDPLPYQCRTRTQMVTTQFLVIHTRNINVHVMRLSKGLEMRFWYFVTVAGAQVQGFCVSL